MSRPDALIGPALLGTGSAILGKARATADLAREAMPHRDPDEIGRRVQIDARYWVEKETTAAELATLAVAQALSTAGLEPRDLRRIILATSTGGDHRIPATANDVLTALDLDDTCDAFDLNNSCVGFLTGLDVAARSAATGLGPVAVVAVETFSKFVAPSEPRPYLVLGDAAAAAVVGTHDQKRGGLLAIHLRNSADLRGRMNTDPEEPVAFHASAEALTQSALQAIAKSSAEVLRIAHRSMDQVRWFLPHQPNGQMLDAIVRGMSIDRERLVPIVQDVGSIGAASIPFSLDRLFRARPVAPGDLILMSGVGAGTAYGAALYEVPA